jgi:anti-anti-sigma factor
LNHGTAPTDDIPDQPESSRTLRPAAFGELAVTADRTGDVHRIHLTGELDIGTIGRVEAELARAEAGDARLIVLDLSGLTFMDSTGVRLVLEAHARSRADSDRLRLRRGSAAVQRIFELSGVTETLPFGD